MSSQSSGQIFRADNGGLIDRSTPLKFSFDGKVMYGYEGDTLASALLANGVSLVGRSFKYHRPRGIVGAGSEEPNALVSLGEGETLEANLKATQVTLYEGLRSRSQNCWPTLVFDLGALANTASALLPAGFYYKTFMWPRSMWMSYEYLIRRAAGLGRAPDRPDPDRYAKRFAHFEVVVVGTGPAGLSCALEAAQSGARILLVDEQTRPGGSLLGCEASIEGRAGPDWAAAALARLEAMDNVEVLQNANAFGLYDDNLLAVAQTLHAGAADGSTARELPRQRLWWIRAARIVLCTGRIERPLVFGGNDCPGVMLASAAQSYAHRYAVRCGRRAVLFTTNDDAYRALPALKRVGVELVAAVDSRAGGPGEYALGLLDKSGARLLPGYVVCEALRSRVGSRLRGVTLAPHRNGRVQGPVRRLETDLLLMSGGFNPTVHLYSQAQGRVRFDTKVVAFVPDGIDRPVSVAGAVTGRFELQEALSEGRQIGESLYEYFAGVASVDGRLLQAGKTGVERTETEAVSLDSNTEQGPENPHTSTGQRNPMEPLWEVIAQPKVRAKAFVDFQNDVTADDVSLAARENYGSVEHLKRYTTLGMGTDQGRTSNVNGLALLADRMGVSVERVGITTFRPPYQPVTLGAVAAGQVGSRAAPLRRTPLHEWHLCHAGVMSNVGAWQRPKAYPRDGESLADAVCREAVAVRQSVGIVDISTLGKVELQGGDAAAFLERVYTNRWANLGIGRCRYGLMLREDGMVFDDGTCTRMADGHFYLTTTTGHAEQVFEHLEFYAQTVWPELDVQLCNVTDQFAAIALAGPRSSEVLASCVAEQEPSPADLAHMAFCSVRIEGIPVRLFRLSYSGELAYELHVPSDHAEHVWQRLLELGRGQAIVPYGTEAMGVLRIEKGHLVHAEIDGRTTAQDLGLQRLLRPDGGFIGARALQREGLLDSSRKRLVGLRSMNGQAIPAGAQLVWNPTEKAPVQMLGHVSSACYSPNIRAHIALALVGSGQATLGDMLYASAPLVGRHVPVRICEPVFIDAGGVRYRG